MKTYLLHAEISFWTIWFALPYIITVLQRGEIFSAVLVLFFCGILLSGIAYLLRKKNLPRFIVNVAASTIFFCFYLLIGYPSVIRPNGETEGWALFLMLLIAAFPLVFFVSLKAVSRILR